MKTRKILERIDPSTPGLALQFATCLAEQAEEMTNEEQSSSAIEPVLLEGISQILQIKAQKVLEKHIMVESESRIPALSLLSEIHVQLGDLACAVDDEELGETQFSRALDLLTEAKTLDPTLPSEVYQAVYDLVHYKK